MRENHSWMKLLVIGALAVSAPALVACGDSDETDPTPDSGTDTDMDTSGDAGMDTTPDAEPDATPDTTPDAEPDTTPDATPDTVEPPVGACLNEADQTILDTVDVTGEAQTCGLGCLGDADPGACAGACVAEETGLSEGCASCYSDIVVCSIDNCLAACASDPSSDACTSCQAENCLADFYTCTGEEPPTSNTIIDVATAAGTFTTLLAALEATDLTEVLEGEGPFTVFAPSDDAFAALPEGTVDALLADPDALSQILLYHVVAGEVPSSAVTTGPATTAADLSIWLSTEDGVMVNEATVVTPDIEADNGIIHVIDQVILPPNLVEFAGYTGQFDTLLAAAGAANLAGLLTTEGPFTVFAPTDDAFALLPEGTVDALLEDPDTLAAILTYHAIVGTAVAAADVEIGFFATAAEGLNAVIHLDEDEELAINNAKIVITDIMTTNGIIHVIDEVILPANIAELASWADDFSTLFAAVGASSTVAGLLSDEDGEFTVFAPTNDAFAALPEGTVAGLLADEPALTQVLAYHALGSVVMAADIAGPGFVDTLAELDFYLGTADGVTVNQANVIATDVLATNGVIHAIDAVILPSDIPTLLGYAPEFSTLLTAVVAADLAGALAGEDLTVFAPNNDAFAALPEGVVAGLLADIPALTNVLTYHVFAGLVDSAAATAAVGSSIEMLNTDAAGITAADGSLFIDGAQIGRVDINATNGIIHELLGVMLPPT